MNNEIRKGEMVYQLNNEIRKVGMAYQLMDSQKNIHTFTCIKNGYAMYRSQIDTELHAISNLKGYRIVSQYCDNNV